MYQLELCRIALISVFSTDFAGNYIKIVKCRKSYLSKLLIALTNFVNCSLNFDGLAQERRNTIAPWLELRLSCTNPLISCSTLLLSWGCLYFLLCCSRFAHPLCSPWYLSSLRRRPLPHRRHLRVVWGGGPTVTTAHWHRQILAEDGRSEWGGRRSTGGTAVLGSVPNRWVRQTQSGPGFSLKMSYQYRKSHCGDLIRQSYACLIRSP